jgi:hypothetical protein
MYFESVAKPYMFGLYQGPSDPAPVMQSGQEDRVRNGRFRWASQETWMSINDFFNTSQIINCSNVSAPYGFHPNGIFIASADGHVQFYQQEMDPNVFVAGVTMAGDEAFAQP